MGVVKNRRVSRRSRFWVSLIAMFIIIGIASFGITLVVCSFMNSNKSPIASDLDEENSEESLDGPAEPAPTEESIQPINFQPVIDEWIKTVKGNESILIYDLDLDEVAGSYNVKEKYNTASLYKLFVVYEGYKRIYDKKWDPNAKAGSTGKTIAKCLDLAIRESHSPCAETLWNMIGHDNLDNTIEKDWKITDSDISKLTSNVNDIMLIMKRFYEHPDFNDPTLLDQMWDSFLNQPNTTYEWRQGLPSGFSKPSVYNKVGWAYDAEGKYWNIYHDAAIVKFPWRDKTRNFIVVVMTNKVDFKNIRQFGKMLEDKFYEDEI